MKFTRILSIAIVFVMLFTVLVACGDKGDGAETTTAAGGTTADPTGGTTGIETDAAGYEVDNLPDKVWDDEVYLFSWRDQIHLEFDSDTETGDTVKDEVYRRKLRLEQKYGITFKIDTQPSYWEVRADFIKSVEANQSETGEYAYDLIGTYFAISGEMTVKGFFEDLSDESLFPYVELSKPWWPDDLLGTARVNNSVYAITGDITPTFILEMSMTHVNLDQVAKYNGEDVDVYQLVRDKEWTYEKIEELALGKSDGVGAEREYAVTMANNVIFDRMLYGGGFTLVKNLDDGSIEIADLTTDQRYLDFYDYAYRFFNENKDVAFVALDAQADPAKGTGAGFKAGNAMFNFGNADNVKHFTTVDFNFGILPMPMYKTSQYTMQDQYYTVHGFWTTLYSAPINSDDKELTSFALEALASDAYRNLTPTWYDTMFKGRYLETPENAEMFDIIHDSIVFDTARIFGTQISMFSAFRKASSSSNWVSYYESNETAWKTAIDQINQSLGG